MTRGTWRGCRALKARRGALRMAEGVLGEHGETGAAAWVRCERCGEWTEDLGREGPVVCGACRVAAGEAVERGCQHCGKAFVATTDPGEKLCAVCWGDVRTRVVARVNEAGQPLEPRDLVEWQARLDFLSWLGLAIVGVVLAVGALMGICYGVGLLLAR